MACKSNVIHEVSAMWLIPYLSKKSTASSLAARISLIAKETKDDKEGLLTCYEKVVNHVLETHTLRYIIAETYKDIVSCTIGIWGSMLCGWWRCTVCICMMNMSKMVRFLKAFHTQFEIACACSGVDTMLLRCSLHTKSRHFGCYRLQHGVTPTWIVTSNSKESPKTAIPPMLCRNQQLRIVKQWMHAEMPQRREHRCRAVERREE